MSNKIVKTKKSNAIFLAIVLVAGTITLSSPSFMIGTQAQPYSGIDNRYNSYYEQQYTDKKYSNDESEYVMDNNNYQKSYGEDRYGPTEYSDNNYYNIYESDYGMDNDNRKSYKTNSYEPTTSYGMDDKKYNSYGYSDYGKDNNDRKSYDKKPYGNDNSYDKSQYQPSYKPDYKPVYPSYGKDKSKDSSKSISINKINCINPNVNFNGDNNGNINTFAASPGRTTANAGTDEGELSAGSFSGGNDGGRYYDDGYNKKDKDFACIINNNNNNTINVAAAAGNATDQCAIDVEACFAQFLNATEFQQLTNALNNGITVKIGENTVTLNSFADMCDALEGLTFEFDSLLGAITDIAFQAGILGLGGGIFECIAESLGIPITPTLAPASVTSELDVPTILQLR